MEIAKTEAVVQRVASRHGMKYVVDGEIPTPLGSRVTLRTIWIVDEGQQHPRFVTADGRTVAVLTLTESEIRFMARGEILHVRELASA